MVFSSYSNASYLPLDSDQGVNFYKNENLLFAPPPPSVVAASPTALVCRRNNSPAVAAAMLTATTGSSPFGGQQPLLHHGGNHGNNVCDDFQPVAHLSSNGYYGYVPPPQSQQANAFPKVMSTEQAAAPVVNGSNGGGGVLLDSIHPASPTVEDSYSMMMMDCGGGGGVSGSGGLVQVENYHQQQQHLRKRKEYSEEVEPNCKRRKTWLEQPNDAGFAPSPNWSQPSSQQMECLDQPMDTFSSQQQQFHQSPITMNAPTTIAFNTGFQHQQPQQQTMISTPPMPAPAPQLHTILQPKNRLFRASSSPPNMSNELVADKQTHLNQLSHHLRNHSHHQRPDFGDDCQQLEDLFISLHGSGFYLAC